MLLRGKLISSVRQPRQPLFTGKLVRLTAERERRPVIVNHGGKSYDTSNGSEQNFEGPAPRVRTEGPAARGRWEDDGGPMYLEPPITVRPLAAKPAWSVLSLADLNEAIRREGRADDPARLRQEAERAERRMVQAVRARDDRVAAAAEAEHDRYRNDWEHR